MTEQENRHIFVIIDYATRWPEAFTIKCTDSRTTAEKLLFMFTRVGVPQEIITDSGANFLGRLMKELYCLLGIKDIISTIPYHPETNRMVKRFNSMLKTMLRKSCKMWSNQWDLARPYVLRRAPNAMMGFHPSRVNVWKAIERTSKKLEVDLDNRPYSATKYHLLHNFSAGEIQESQVVVVPE